MVRMCNKHIEWIDSVPSSMETESEIGQGEYRQMSLERELRCCDVHLDVPRSIQQEWMDWLL